MMVPRKRRRSLPFLVFLLCLVLGYAVYRALELTEHTGSTEVTLASSEKVPALAPQPRFAMPPITTYGETVKRPLFSPSRRPPVETTDIPVPKPVPKSDFKARLVADPKAALRELFGVDFEEGVEIEVLEETAEKQYLVLPVETPGLSEVELEQVAGGARAQSLFGQRTGTLQLRGLARATLRPTKGGEKLGASIGAAVGSLRPRGGS